VENIIARKDKLDIILKKATDRVKLKPRFY
jgi:hypothetical protein